MPLYNEMFELSVSDIDLIETALRHKRDALSQELIDLAGKGKGEGEKTLRQVQDLLGRLHNQKVFYRPRDGVYVGG